MWTPWSKRLLEAPRADSSDNLDPSGSPDPSGSHEAKNSPEPSYSPTPQPEPGPQPDPLAQANPLAPSEPRPLGERLKGWLDALLVADVFLVIGAALWFGLAVLLHSRGVEAPLQLFERLWQPLFLPAISLLMAAAIVSGLLGWWRRRGQR